MNRHGLNSMAKKINENFIQFELEFDDAFNLQSYISLNSEQCDDNKLIYTCHGTLRLSLSDKRNNSPPILFLLTIRVSCSSMILASGIPTYFALIGEKEKRD